MPAPKTARIKRARIPKDTVTLARWLLGKVVVRKLPGRRMTVRITETEAYLQHDPACHAYRGMTARNRSLFLDRGHAYVYLCYGTAVMLNVSSEHAGIGTGVLIRSAEPLSGIEANLRGPGRLTAALKIDLTLDGIDLFEDPKLWIGDDGHEVGAIGISTRIGLTKGADERLRFFVAGNAHLSGTRRLNAPPVLP